MLDAGQANYTLTCDVVPTWSKSGANERCPQIMVRWADTSNFWVVYLTASFSAIQLYEISGGSATLRGTYSYGFTSGTSYAVTVTASG